MIDSNCTDSYFWGLKPYGYCQKLQELTWAQVSKSQHPGLILGGEIYPVITQGVRAQDRDLLSPPNVEIYKVKRGGETTLHSPGQLIIYPIISVRNLGIGVRDYVRSLLKISAICFNQLELKVYESENPVGLFTEYGKIGFCGLQIKNGVSLHGLALNISNDLSHFNSIVSCGLKKINYDKLQLYNKSISAQDVFNLWVETAFQVGILQKNQNQVLNWPLRASDFQANSELEWPVQDQEFLGS
jgi:lipoyl(octanoyl) transferase